MLEQRSWFPMDGLQCLNMIPSQQNVDITRREQYEFIRRIDPLSGEAVQSANEDDDDDNVAMGASERASSSSSSENHKVAAGYEVQDIIPDILLFSCNVGQGYQCRKVSERIFASPGQLCKI